jgi:two-component system, OmpR family, sensor histidine kinase BaeS
MIGSTAAGSGFGRLRTKLFLAIAGANALLAAVAYLVFSASFDRGLAETLGRADQARLEAFVGALAEGYGRERGWRWLADDRDRWTELSREALGLPRRPAGEGASQPAGSPRELPLTVSSRLLLFDADRKLLAGPAELAARAELKPIVREGAVVGYLGAVPRRERIESLERVIAEQQRWQFAAIALGMLGASLLLGAGLAHWLTRRVRALARGADALMRGDYDARVPDAGSDELGSLARDFNALAATLAATRRARSQWIADIAHELRTPLAVLRGEIEALQDGVRPLGQASLGSLAQEVAHLGRLVDDLHTLSLADVGALSYHKEPLDLAELADEAIGVQRRALEERGLAVELELERGATVLADETRLAQVFGNLLQNTLRYTDAPGKVAVAVRREGERVVLDWQDSSPGVPEAELPRLTDRLYRVDASRSRVGGGSGLGLAIVKAIVEAHGGTLVARASRLGGLALEVALPAARTAHV